jgi:hypothetical protein
MQRWLNGQAVCRKLGAKEQSFEIGVQLPPWSANGELRHEVVPV